MTTQLTELPVIPPPRLTEGEILRLSGITKSQLSKRKAKGEWPPKLYWTRDGYAYRGEDVYRALGYTVDTKFDPFYEE